MDSSTGASQPTIYDVAARAGVSIATVSRALNSPSGLRRHTLDRVLEAVRELQYVPSGPARSLSRGRTMIIGLIFAKASETERDTLRPDESESLLYTDAIIRGAEDSAQRANYGLLLAGASGPNALSTVTRIAAQADGLLLVERVAPEASLAKLARRIPLVWIAGSGRSAGLPTVRVDNAPAMVTLTRHLVLDHGYRELAFLGEVPGSPDAEDRARTVTKTATALGVHCAGGPEWFGNFTAAAAEAVVERHLARVGRLPRALIAASDQTALGALHVLRRHGITVPDQVALTGFDDIPIVRHIDVALTTVYQPIAELGATGARLLLQLINGQPEPLSNPILPTRVVYRRSCGCAGFSEVPPTGLSNTNSPHEDILVQGDSNLHPSQIEAMI
jgi:LacI family transcriptional regulator